MDCKCHLALLTNQVRRSKSWLDFRSVLVASQNPASRQYCLSGKKIGRVASQTLVAFRAKLTYPSTMPSLEIAYLSDVIMPDEHGQFSYARRHKKRAAVSTRWSV